jgi:hypothetical protein
MEINMRYTPEIKTVKQAKEALALLGMTLRREFGEYKVNFKGASSNSAYYTTCISDACNTALSMSHEALNG